MSEFLGYQLAIANKETAKARYEYASANLNLNYIFERNAELKSQGFKYAGEGKLFKHLGKITDREREIGLAFARYVVYGRTD